jgi:hypothetical protein
VGDCSDFFLALMASERYSGLPFFVYGESMGGEFGAARQAARWGFGLSVGVYIFDI